MILKVFTGIKLTRRRKISHSWCVDGEMWRQSATAQSTHSGIQHPNTQTTLCRGIFLFSNNWPQLLGCAIWECPDLPTRIWGTDNVSFDLFLTTPISAAVNMKKKCRWLLTGSPAFSRWVEFEPWCERQTQIHLRCPPRALAGFVSA